MHELLPWYANDTLGPEERVVFEEHLAACALCRAELEQVEEMRKKIREAGPAAFSDHPSPEVLLAAVRPGQADTELDAKSVREVRQHLALCLTCADEAEWLTGEAVAAAAGDREEEEPDELPDEPRSIAAARRRRSVMPWLGLVAALVVIAVLVPLVFRSPAPGPVSTRVVRSVRSVLPLETIGVPRDSTRVVLMFEVDLGTEDFPVRLVIEPGPDGGEAIVTADFRDASSLDSGAFLSVLCPRELCEDGTYVARLTRAGDGPAIEYRFRLGTKP